MGLSAVECTLASIECELLFVVLRLIVAVMRREEERLEAMEIPTSIEIKHVLIACRIRAAYIPHCTRPSRLFPAPLKL